MEAKTTIFGAEIRLSHHLLENAGVIQLDGQQDWFVGCNIDGGRIQSWYKPKFVNCYFENIARRGDSPGGDDGPVFRGCRVTNMTIPLHSGFQDCSGSMDELNKEPTKEKGGIMAEEAREEKRPEPKFHLNERVIWHTTNEKPHGTITDMPIWDATMYGSFYAGSLSGWSYIVCLDNAMARILGERVLEQECKQTIRYCQHCGHKLEE